MPTAIYNSQLYILKINLHFKFKYTCIFVDKQPPTEPQDGSTSNPFDEPAKEQSPPPTSPGRNAALVSTWLPDAQYVDCHDVGVGNERVDSADVIGVRLTYTATA